MGRWSIRMDGCVLNGIAGKTGLELPFEQVGVNGTSKPGDLGEGFQAWEEYKNLEVGSVC